MTCFFFAKAWLQALFSYALSGVLSESIPQHLFTWAWQEPPGTPQPPNSAPLSRLLVVIFCQVFHSLFLYLYRLGGDQGHPGDFKAEFQSSFAMAPSSLGPCPPDPGTWTYLLCSIRQLLSVWALSPYVLLANVFKAKGVKIQGSFYALVLLRVVGFTGCCAMFKQLFFTFYLTSVFV